MAKKFFVSASPKAVEGIRKAYAGKNAEIHAKLQKDGTVMVVVETIDDIARKPKRSGGWLKRRPAQVAA